MTMNEVNSITNYVVVGGGTAGWISAAILSKALRNQPHKISVVESPDIPTIGVGEATIPSFVDLLEYLQIPLAEFVAKTGATFKLGIKFVDWKQKGHHYWHQFGEVGNKIDGVNFYQHWLKHHSTTQKYEFTDFSPAVALAKQHKFFIPSPEHPTNLSKSTFALHFDASKVAKFLKQYCLSHSVEYVPAKVCDVTKNNDGSICSLVTDEGKELEGDFFFDCSGQRALLIGKALRVGYTNWQHHLPVNSAIAVQSESRGEIPPYTESVALEHGWRWRIPLQERIGNGYVYCSDFCSDENARQTLLANIERPTSEPRKITFTTGVRQKIWDKNCVAVGLSSGFLEPLESTSIYLVMRTMLKFVQSLPSAQLFQPTIDEFNRLMVNEYEYIRDFIILHYCVSERQDSDFWRMWRHMELPDSLKYKIELFKCQGRLMDNHYDLFSHESWYAVLEGMGVRPRSYDPAINNSDDMLVAQALDKSFAALQVSASKCLDHKDYLDKLIAAFYRAIA